MLRGLDVVALRSGGRPNRGWVPRLRAVGFARRNRVHRDHRLSRPRKIQDAEPEPTVRVNRLTNDDRRRHVPSIRRVPNPTVTHNPGRIPTKPLKAANVQGPEDHDNEPLGKAYAIRSDVVRPDAQRCSAHPSSYTACRTVLGDEAPDPDPKTIDPAVDPSSSR